MGNKNGTDWENAMGSEEFSLSLIDSSPGDIYHIAAGTYYPVADANGTVPQNSRLKTFLVKNGVQLQGGYDADGNFYNGNDYTSAQAILSGNIGDPNTCNDDVYRLFTFGDNIDNVTLNSILVQDSYCNNNQVEKSFFKEDFGGNNIADPRVSEVPLPSYVTSEYPFSSQNENSPHNRGIFYGLFKYNVNKFGSINSSKETWHTKFDDRTSANDTSTGYMLAVETGRNTNIIYERTIDNLCSNARLYFSAKIANLSVKATDTWGWELDPVLKFELVDENDNIIITYITGPIPRDPINALQWRDYGFPFELPQSLSSVKLRVSNHLTSGWQEAAVVIDDMEIKYVTPPITVKAYDETGGSISKICESSYALIKGIYENNGVFGNHVTATIEFKPKGDNQWMSLNSIVSNTDNMLEVTWENNEMLKENEGYYRVRVGNTNTINDDNCCLFSDSIYLGIRPKLNAPDIRIKLCPQSNREIALSSYVDSAGTASLEWKNFRSSPVITPGTEATTATVNSGDFKQGTYAYQYKVTGECGIDSAKLYITVFSKIQDMPPADTIVVCKELESSKRINLNRILGLEVKGRWIADNTVNPDNTVARNITALQAPAINSGLLIFDAVNAWNEAAHTNYLVQGGYNGDMNSKIFKIRYSFDPASNCLGNNTGKDIVIIVTEKLIH